MKNYLFVLVTVAMIALYPDFLFGQQDQDAKTLPSSEQVSDTDESGSEYHIKGLQLSFEDDSPPEKLRLKVKRSRRNIWQGEVSLSDDDLADIKFESETDFNEDSEPENGRNQNIFLTIESDQFVRQWITLVKDGDSLSPKKRNDIKLFKKRFAVVNYAYYDGDNPDFSDREPTHHGVKALGNSDHLPGFDVDCGFSQAGKNLILYFHRYTGKNGLIRIGGKEPFDTMTKAPDEGYKPSPNTSTAGFKLASGDCFYFRLSTGYGKLLVQEITVTPPALENADAQKK